jgi:CRP-like cAMP-binding protein
MVIDLHARIERSLRASRLFAEVDADLLSTFARRAARKRLERGTHVWHVGQPAYWMAVIVSGLVKIVQHEEAAIVAIFGAHETFGEMAVVSGGGYSADAIAATREVDLVFVEASAVKAAFESNPAFSAAMGRSLVAHGKALQEKIRIMSAGSVERRLAALLQHLTERFGDELEDGTHVVPVALSRAELASLVGATIETTIRTMSRWQKQGIVSTSREGFVVHTPQRLAAIRGGASHDVRQGSRTDRDLASSS